MKKGTILITLGLLLITAALCLTGYNLYESYRAGEASESVLSELEEAMDMQNPELASGEDSDGQGNQADQNGASTSTDKAGASASAENGNETGETVNMGELYPDRDMPYISVESINYIGYISIPALGIKLPVQSDWVYDLLTISPARYSGSVYQDNMIIGGHSYITHFRALRGIAAGTKVIFYDTEGFAYEYEVSNTMSLNPEQGGILSDETSEDWDLTLFTCNTGGSTRCIVRCERVKE